MRQTRHVSKAALLQKRFHLQRSQHRSHCWNQHFFHNTYIKFYKFLFWLCDNFSNRYISVMTEPTSFWVNDQRIRTYLVCTISSIDSGRNCSVSYTIVRFREKCGFSACIKISEKCQCRRAFTDPRFWHKDDADKTSAKQNWTFGAMVA